MEQLGDLLSRDSTNNSTVVAPLTVNLLLALLVLALVTLLAGIILVLIRRRQRLQRAQLLSLGIDNRKSKHRRHNATTVHTWEHPIDSRSWLHREKQNFIDTTSGPSPASPVPEIRITFPEEFDEAGKRTSGRVMVVHVGEQGLGLEPVPDDLPSYKAHSAERFSSLDLDTMGGSREMVSVRGR